MPSTVVLFAVCSLLFTPYQPPPLSKLPLTGNLSIISFYRGPSINDPSIGDPAIANPAAIASFSILIINLIAPLRPLLPRLSRVFLFLEFSYPFQGVLTKSDLPLFIYISAYLH
ncbi:hypothetical protein [Scardovia inopinata]|uniref:hypothetical protein n=1 Tax=Scardovia inopinata TaxID=78259 RepID=UPI0011C03CB3|nr:hypothetical protein [Scardovia inopinata]